MFEGSLSDEEKMESSSEGDQSPEKTNPTEIQTQDDKDTDTESPQTPAEETNPEDVTEECECEESSPQTSQTLGSVESLVRSSPQTSQTLGSVESLVQSSPQTSQTLGSVESLVRSRGQWRSESSDLTDLAQWRVWSVQSSDLTDPWLSGGVARPESGPVQYLRPSHPQTSQTLGSVESLVQSSPQTSQTLGSVESLVQSSPRLTDPGLSGESGPVQSSDLTDPGLSGVWPVSPSGGESLVQSSPQTSQTLAQWRVWSRPGPSSPQTSQTLGSVESLVIQALVNKLMKKVLKKQPATKTFHRDALVELLQKKALDQFTVPDGVSLKHKNIQKLGKAGARDLICEYGSAYKVLDSALGPKSSQFQEDTMKHLNIRLKSFQNQPRTLLTRLFPKWDKP
ncbi:hypothetical protein WMY93_033446 [Mugilogobius chulae]|uniref:Uncharacterized protein n=1 Tax=Mugilogobius chulae TaxID=88201 RepID=A0AAW0ML81_9GOBI